jgi:transposase
MIYAEVQDSKAQQDLNDAIQEAKVKKWYVRLLIIALSTQKYTVQKLSQMFNLCQATVRNYIHAYNQGGLQRLKPVKQPGRPAKLADWTKEQWDKILERTPNQYHQLNTESRQWTLDLLVMYVKEYHQLDVCRSSVYHSLRKTGRRTGRSKLRVGSPDPDYTVKRNQVEKLRHLAFSGQLTSHAVSLIVPDKQLKRLGYPQRVDDVVLETPILELPKRCGRLFFFDEANVSWCPQSGRVYRVIGEEAKVNTPGKNQTKYLLGSLEYPTGEGLYEIYPRKRHEEVQAHFEHLLEMYPNDFLFVVRDNASSHITADLDHFLQQNKPRFCLVPLPTYSPHLNLIERLWHYMRDKMTRSHFYQTFNKLCQALVKWLKKLPFERFQSLMGVGSNQ